MEFYRPRKAKTIEDEDIRFCLLGKVKDVGNGFFILSDETGDIKISSNFIVEKGSLVRVFCSRVGDEIFADFVQKMEGLDWDLWKRVESLYLRLL